MAITPITGEVNSQRLNENFSYLDSEKTNKSEFNTIAKQLGGLQHPSDVNKQVKLSPTITIIDDDVRNQLYDLLYPVAAQRNIPITSALISSRVGVDPNSITDEQFEEMRDSGLVEFVNHTHDHVHLDELTPEEIDYQIRMCQEWLLNKGVYTKHLVYPFGRFNETIREIAKKYVDSGSLYGGSVFTPSSQVLDAFQVKRVQFEAELATIQSHIDTASTSNGWMVINTHAQYDTFDTVKLNAIIDYAESKGVTFRKFTDAYEMFKNLLELRNNGEISTGISSLGYRIGVSDLDIKHPNTIEDPTIDSPPSFFESMKVTTVTFSTSRAQEAGFPGAGTLYTSRRHNDDYTYQEYHPIFSKKILKRSWDSGINKWTEFGELVEIKRHTLLVGPYTIPAGSSQNLTVTHSALEIGKSCIVTPNNSLTNGLTYSFAMTGQGTGILRIYNVSSNQLTLEAGNWVFTCI